MSFVVSLYYTIHVHLLLIPYAFVPNHVLPLLSFCTLVCVLSGICTLTVLTVVVVVRGPVASTRLLVSTDDEVMLDVFDFFVFDFLAEEVEVGVLASACAPEEVEMVDFVVFDFFVFVLLAEEVGIVTIPVAAP